MCDAGSAAVATVMVASTLYSAEQQKKAGDSQNAFYQYQANLSEKNKRDALAQGEENAYYLKEEGIQNIKQFQMSKKTFEGSQTVALAASGIQGATAEQVVMDSATRLEMDKQAIYYNTEVSMYSAKKGAQLQGQILDQQASQYRYQGAMSAIQGRMNATGTLLSGGAQTAMTVNSAYRAGSKSSGGKDKTTTLKTDKDG